MPGVVGGTEDFGDDNVDDDDYSDDYSTTDDDGTEAVFNYDRYYVGCFSSGSGTLFERVLEDETSMTPLVRSFSRCRCACRGEERVSTVVDEIDPRPHPLPKNSMEVTLNHL